MEFIVTDILQMYGRFPLKYPLREYNIKSNSVIMSWKGPNKLCRYKRLTLWAKCIVIMKKKYFKANYRP